MTDLFYDQLKTKALAQEIPDDATSRTILTDDRVDVLSLVYAAYAARLKYKGKEVHVHVLNNVQNGHCPEDCHYCAQSRDAETAIEEYPVKSDQEILQEAEQAYRRGAYRYCLVFAGRGPSDGRIRHLTGLIREIKRRYPLEVCVSAGLLDESKARQLKEAGLDRYNHNLNTSEALYPRICSTHTYGDRLNTLSAAKRAGLAVCSGVIVGMGEGPDDIIDMAKALRRLGAASIPVNFFLPIPGVRLTSQPSLSPRDCLRILCLFRLINPAADIRVAAGREHYLKSMEVMALYVANSLFVDGYLNARGQAVGKTLAMIREAGFVIKSEVPVDQLLNKVGSAAPDLKGSMELRPYEQTGVR